MPELPEVESTRVYLSKYCVNQKIKRVNLLEQGNGPRDGLFDDIIFETNDQYNRKVYEDSILNKFIKSIKRKGKYLWFELSDKKNTKVVVNLLFHFGMTGSFLIKGKSVPQYKSFKVDDQWPPRFCKFEVVLDNDLSICFTDPRRLATIKILQRPLEELPILKLGLDPLLDKLPSEEDLFEMMKNMKVPIKSLLLDQEKIFCGIGNYLADEILYQSKIHPESKCNELTLNLIHQLKDKVSCVIETAVEYSLREEEFPSDWLFHYRWSKRNKNQACMPDGNKIQFITIGGRTSAIVPNVQHKVIVNTKKRSASVQIEKAPKKRK